MRNKAQVTLFMILGFVILIAVGFLLQLRSTTQKIDIEETMLAPSQYAEVDVFVENCLKEVAGAALIDTGLQGGYYETPELSADYFYVDVPYYYYENENLMPSKGKIEEEISAYINDALASCTANFSEFDFLSIEAGLPKTETTIGKDVIIKVDYPITIRQDNQEKKLPEFSITVPIRLNEIYGLSTSIIEEQMEDPENICLSCLVSLGIEKDMYIELMTYEDNVIFFTIIDNNSIINKEPYLFTFANKY